LKKILVDPRDTSNNCSICGEKVEEIDNNTIFCKKCILYKNIHMNSAENIAKRAIKELKRKIESQASYS
jgi:transposase